MKCPNCGFENIPGAERCFRCETLLKTEEKINFYPPRARNKNNIKGLERRKNRSFLKD